MTQVQQQALRPLSGKCYSSDREILEEIGELLQDVDDVHFGTVQCDPFRRQITAKLEDGRTLRLTMVIE